MPSPSLQPPASNLQPRIGIVGSGILGLTLALRLSEAGFRVTVLEKDSKIGGLLTPARIGNYTWDRFYHVILSSDSNVLELLERLGLRDRIRWKPTKTGFLNDGHLYSMSNIKEFLAFPPLRLIDKVRLGWTIFYASKIKAWERLEGVPVTYWLKHLSGGRTFNKIWLPLLKSKLGNRYEVTNASFIWASIARMYEARRTGLKQEMFGYVAGGYGTILKELQATLESLDLEVLCGNEVTKVSSRDGHVEIETATQGTIRFDGLVLTIPSNQLAKTCPQFSAAEKIRFEKGVYQSVISAALILKNPLAGYYITNITDDGVPFTAVIEMTAVVDKEYFDGHSLIYLPRYLAHEDPLWSKTDDEILDEFISGLQRVYPSVRRGDIIASAITRAEEVFPITTLNYSSELLPATKTSLKHVFVVNSAQIPNGTMNVNEIVSLANKKAKEIAKLVGG
jgi:protoporphyrinogen oxidase